MRNLALPQGSQFSRTPPGSCRKPSWATVHNRRPVDGAAPVLRANPVAAALPGGSYAMAWSAAVDSIATGWRALARRSECERHRAQRASPPELAAHPSLHASPR